ncbi:MAG TPA: T9SS type A sorting domain-containing protein [Bacteroidia bacterium]|nr:T9SS type A sorting domain-containing protein [Bacteroidia bacterium]HNT82611.1 T9SS type A sorting domain-containing protein [Bacteroidia bacterium]
MVKPLIKSLRLAMFVLLVLVPAILSAQNYLPKSYYTFEGSKPMKDSMNHFDLDPSYYRSGYTINSNPAGVGVGNYMTLDSNSTIIRGGTLSIDSAVTFEFLFKPGFYFGTTVFAKRMDGAIELRFSYPTINFMTYVTTNTGSGVNDDFAIDLNGIGRKNYGYYVDGNWHHIVFKYNAKAGIKEVWIDGQLPAGFSKTIQGGSFATSGNLEYMVNSQSNYYKYQGGIDEFAVYYNSLGGNSIYSHYLDFMAGKHYSFANPTVTAPTPSPVTAGININDYAPGHPSPTLTPIEQLKNFPVPRFKPGHTLFPNNPFVGYYYLSGYQTYESSTSKAIANSVTLQTDFAKNFNYTIMAAENTGAFDDYNNSSTFSYAWINLANQNPQFKVSALSYWPQLHPSDAGYKSNTSYATCQCLPDKYYLRNSSGQYLNPNGGTGSTKYLSPAGAPDSLVMDGQTQKYYLQKLLNKLTRPLDYLFDNGEVIPYLYYSNAMTYDPNVVSDKNSSGLDWFTYEGKRAATKIKAYRDQFMGISGLSNTKFAYYQLDGQPTWNLKWSEVRSVNTMMNGSSYATGDIYMRWPYNWRYWSGAWKGWQWVVESRREQLLSGDKYYSPAVSPGWDNDETQNVRPAQWLGFLKALAMSGAEFFTTGYFVTSTPYQNPKNYIWQMVIPPYAQAITTRYEDLFRNGYLMEGDVPNDPTNPTFNAYSFRTGDPRKLVVVRKHNSLNKYAITGSIQPMSNMAGAVEDESNTTIKLDGNWVKFKVRRQGSTYFYDNTNPNAPIFYQLDGWHENTYPYYWTKDFKTEAELFDNSNSNVYLKTTRPSGVATGDFTNFTTCVGFNAVSDISYNFQPRSTTNYTYYVWVRARSKNAQTTGMTISLDGANSKQIGCITDTNWQWYCYDVSNGQPISFSNVTSLNDHVLKITPTNTNIEIDQIHLSTSSGAIYSTPAPCASGVVIPTISASGPLAFCAGGNVKLTASAGNSYLWSNGATTQAITVTSSGTYSVTVNTSTGSGTSAPVTVTVNSLPTATISANGPTTFAQGGSVTLTSSSAGSGGSYLWSNGSTSQSIVVTTGGNYTVIVTNSNGCSATSSAMTVTVTTTVPTPKITASGPTTFCQGGSVTLTCSAASSYLWNTGATTQSITVTTAGMYSCTITTASGSATSPPVNVIVTAATPASISASGSTTFCQGGAVNLTASAGSSYLWSTGATTQAITATAGGTYTVTVTSNGCAATASKSVTVYSLPVATITASGSTNLTQGGSVTLTSSTGSSYLWSTGATTKSITVTSAGSYVVTVTNSNGCSKTSAPTVVTVSNGSFVPTITVSGNLSFCSGGKVVLTASKGASYLWSTGAKTRKITVYSAGTYSVTVTQFNTGAVGTSATVVVTVLPAPTATISASGSTTICQGSTVNLTSSSGSSYLWNTGATSRTISVGTAGSYSVTVTGSNGCSATSAATAVTVNNCGGGSNCPIPTNPHTVNINGSSAELRWDYVGAQNYYFKVENMNNGSVYTSNALNSGVTSITIGASPNTTYRWYVRSGCGGSTYSAWTSYVQFTTPSARFGEGSNTEGIISTEISIFPNPATTYVEFLLHSNTNTSAVAVLYDLTGREVYKQSFRINEGENTNTISVESFARGTYLLKIETDGNVKMAKIQIQ